METRNEKWESLRLEAQKFVPQEYCDTCWLAEVECRGQSASQGTEIRWISFPPETIQYDLHWSGHGNHKVQYFLRMPDGVTPTPADVDKIIGVVSDGENVQGIKVAFGVSSRNNPNNNHPEDNENGWGWLNTDGKVHFTYNPSFDIYSKSPNHS